MKRINPNPFILVLCIYLIFSLSLSGEMKIADVADVSLEDLLNSEVITVSKKIESVNDAPGIVTVITREEIQGFAARNLGEVLMKVVGVAFLSPDVFTNQSIVFRGQEMTPYNNHTLILLNGRPVRDPITGGHNAVIWTGFPLDAIEKIEIIRGPGSVLYGSCAYAGVVNIITKKPKEDGSSGNLTLGLGSFGAFSQEAGTMFRKGDFQAMISINHYRDKGPEYEFADYSGVHSSDFFFRKNLGIVTALQYKGFTLNALYADMDPYCLSGNENWAPGYSNRHKTYFLDIGYSLNLSDQFSINANFTYNEHHWINSPDKWMNKGKSPLFEINTRYRPTKNLNILLGGGYENSSWKGEILNDNELDSFFIYSQVDYRINETFKLIGGFQYNKIKNIEGNLSPRLGLVIAATKHLGLKILYSDAFRKGYPNETSFGVSVFRGNLELEPEVIRTIEAQVLYSTDSMNLSLTYYNSQMKNIITRRFFPDPTLTPPFYLQYLNGGTWNFWGMELEGKFTIKKNLFFTFNAYYQKNKNEAQLENATLHPNTMVKAGLFYSDAKLTVGVFNSYFGEPYETSLVNPGSQMINPNPEAFNLLSLKVAYKLLRFDTNKNLTITLEGDNLLDKDIRYPDYPNKKINSFIPLSSGTAFTAKFLFNF